MTTEQRYNLIKQICETEPTGQLPTTKADIQDEFSRFNTTLETTPIEQDSRLWQRKFLQDLIFGTS